MTLHKCEGALPHSTYGPAIDTCGETEGRELWVTNGEYSSQVSFCPYCGFKAKNLAEIIYKENLNMLKITIEGPPKSGKTDFVENLRDYLLAQRYSCVIKDENEIKTYHSHIYPMRGQVEIEVQRK